MKQLKNRISLARFSCVLSIFTLLAYHKPFFRFTLSEIPSDFNGWLIFGGLLVVMPLLNYFFYYLVMFAGRIVGRIILSILFIANALCLYFINTYEVFITDKMLGNLYNTNYTEASGFFSVTMVLYVIFLGIVPAVYTMLRKVDYGSIKRGAAHIIGSLALALISLTPNIHNWTWIHNRDFMLGGLLMPWSYTINSVRYFNSIKKPEATKEIMLPDAHIANTSKDVCVLVIGESARRKNFSLYGYERETNPLLATDSVTILPAYAAATYTIASVKAILDHKPTEDAYEILPNYLYRHGVDVVWRTSNGGEPKVYIEAYHDAKDHLAKMYPHKNPQYDDILIEELDNVIRSSSSDKLFIVLHTYTSHGPAYYRNYPSEFEQFKPVCTTVEIKKANRSEVINAYDNTILYTDYLLHSVIEHLRSITDRRSCMIYVSDHGESLGEREVYMHAISKFMAPDEQIDIPFIVWSSDKSLRVKPLEDAGHYHIFHSVMHFLGLESEIFDPTMSIFE